MPRSCLVRPAGAARGGGWSVERWVRWVGAALPASDSAQMHHASAAAGTLGGPYVAPRGASTKRRRCREFDACDGACGRGPVLSSTVLVVRGSSLGGCGGRPSAEAGAVADELAVRGEHHPAVGASDLCGPRCVSAAESKTKGRHGLKIKAGALPPDQPRFVWPLAAASAPPCPIRSSSRLRGLAGPGPALPSEARLQHSSKKHPLKSVESLKSSFDPICRRRTATMVTGVLEPSR